MPTDKSNKANLGDPFKACYVCGAEFGIKFKKYTCSICMRAFCEGHLVSKSLFVSSHEYSNIYNKDGVCYQCLLEIYEKADVNLIPPKGVFGRLKSMLYGFKLFRKDPRLNIIINKVAFSEIIYHKTMAILWHQKDVPTDFMISDLTIFARVYSINVGLKGEKEINLKDIYRVVDWVRNHPKLPGFVHGITWHSLENVSITTDYFLDIWHITNGVLAFLNPALGIPWAAYHLGDRAMDQVEGKGLLNWTLDKTGLNINLKNAISYWIAGNVLLKLYEKE